MTRAASRLDRIRKHLPKGRRLPAELTGFAKLVVSERGARHDLLELTWTDPLPLLNADRGALDAMLPFLRLGDGGVIALFWHDASPCVVHCDSEGGAAVIASSFADFLVRLARPTRELLERLEIESALDTAKLVEPGAAKARIPASLSRSFAAWIESHSLSAKPTASPDARVLADRLLAISKRMISDGLSKVYNSRSIHWTTEFRIERGGTQGTEWTITYLDYGKWLPLPARYDVLALWPELLRSMKKPNARSFELSVWKDGHVFVDRGNQLTIEPR